MTEKEDGRWPTEPGGQLGTSRCSFRRGIASVMIHADTNIDTYHRGRVPQFLSHGLSIMGLRPGSALTYESHRGWPTGVATTATGIMTNILDRLSLTPSQPITRSIE